MRNLGFLFLLLTTSLFANVHQRLANGAPAYYGADFYANPKLISKDSLYKILNGVHTPVKGRPDAISNSCGNTACYKHTSVGYDSARKIMFGELFIKKDNGRKYILDVYCGQRFYFQSLDQVSGMHTEVNIEHTWPQSRFNPSFDKNMQKSDMHHLYLTDSLANNRRGNFPFGEIGNNADELNVDDCDISHLFHGRNGMLFTPPTTHQGNVARSLFYFATRYNLVIDSAQEKTLRMWDKADPIDQAERDRHEMIAKHQKVRNPFIDFPALVDGIRDF